MTVQFDGIGFPTGPPARRFNEDAAKLSRIGDGRGARAQGDPVASSGKTQARSTLDLISIRNRVLWSELSVLMEIGLSIEPDVVVWAYIRKVFGAERKEKRKIFMCVAGRRSSI